MEIKNIHGKVLFSADCDTVKECVELAIKSGVGLYGAELYGVNLSGADLSGANLYGANLSDADLSGVNLYGANLSDAYLYDANLSGANLNGVNLSGAYLYGANLSNVYNAKYTLALLCITPTEGAFVGWKKLKGGVIAKLIIPHDAQRVNSAGSRKCRASKAYVEEIFGASEGYDHHTGKLLYKVGEWVYPDEFDPSITIECSHGIHFFLTRIEAEKY